MTLVDLREKHERQERRRRGWQERRESNNKPAVSPAEAAKKRRAREQDREALRELRRGLWEAFRLLIIITLAILLALQIQGWLVAEGLRNILGS